MKWTLEVVCVPVADVDRAKAFYTDGLGFNVDYDIVHDETTRVVQLTAPGSGCSIAIGTGIFDWPGAPVPAVSFRPFLALHPVAADRRPERIGSRAPALCLSAVLTELLGSIRNGADH